ncbi:hypothetical protein [Allohahella marinimesophila]|uniref:Uncharacterized protein n=1 Tax=Allohahella marinimesophila TaxID=1054972 RepID=A0ABP7NWL1_9GAMM
MPDILGWAHEKEIDLRATINWSTPLSEDMLPTGMSADEDTAYFYAIVGRFEREWQSYYIGMVYSQFVSTRHRNNDHLTRLKDLKSKHPDTVWHLTLGTLTLQDKRLNEGLVKKVEGLLIYSHWHDKCVSRTRSLRFSCDQSIQISNTGFNEPFHKTVAYGALVSG